MRTGPATLILLLMPLFAEPDAAHASPVFLHALSDSELAANSAGRAITLRMESNPQSALIALPGLQIVVADVFGIATRVRDAGAESISQAETGLTLKANLKDF